VWGVGGCVEIRPHHHDHSQKSGENTHADGSCKHNEMSAANGRSLLWGEDSGKKQRESVYASLCVRERVARAWRDESNRGRRDSYRFSATLSKCFVSRIFRIFAVFRLGLIIM
jgi:hypothetical protein